MQPRARLVGSDGRIFSGNSVSLYYYVHLAWRTTTEARVATLGSYEGRATVINIDNFFNYLVFQVVVL